MVTTPKPAQLIRPLQVRHPGRLGQDPRRLRRSHAGSTEDRHWPGGTRRRDPRVLQRQLRSGRCDPEPSALRECGQARDCTITLLSQPWSKMFTAVYFLAWQQRLDLPKWNASVLRLGTDVPVRAELILGSSACAICWQGRPSRRASTRSAWYSATVSSSSSPSAARSPSASLAGALSLPLIICSCFRC